MSQQIKDKIDEQVNPYTSVKPKVIGDIIKELSDESDGKANLEGANDFNTKPTVNGDPFLVASDIQPVNIVNSGATLSIATQGNYTFNGTVAVWTLPSLASSVKFRLIIMNQGSDTLTINSNTGGNDIFMGTPVAMITVGVGEVAILYNNGISFFRQL